LIAEGITSTAWTLSPQQSLTAQSHLEFDARLHSVCEYVAVGLARSLEPTEEQHIIIAKSSSTPGIAAADITNQISPQLNPPKWQHYHVLLGNVYEAGDYGYFTLVSACEDEEPSLTVVEIKNVQLYVGETSRVRPDGQCGPSFLGPFGGIAECDGDSPCCSSDGFCGITSEHCDCDQCVDYRPSLAPTSAFAFANASGCQSPPSASTPPPSFTIRTRSWSSAEETHNEYVDQHSLDVAVERGSNESYTKTQWSITLTGDTRLRLRLPAPFHFQSSTHLSLDIRQTGCHAYGIAFSNTSHLGTNEDILLTTGRDASTLDIPIGLSIAPGPRQYIWVFGNCSTSKVEFHNIRLSASGSNVDFSKGVFSFGASDQGNVISASRRLVTTKGSVSKAAVLASPTVLLPSAHLHFDIAIEGECSEIDVGLAPSFTSTQGVKMFRLKGDVHDGSVDESRVMMAPAVSNWRSVALPVGLHIPAAETYSYFVLTSTCTPASTVSVGNVFLQELADVLKVSQMDTTSFDDAYDGTSKYQFIPGEGIKMFGQTSKKFQFPKPLVVSPTTRVEFDAQVLHLCSRHGLSLVSDVDGGVEANTVVFLAGSHQPRSWLPFANSQPLTTWTHVSIPLGLLFPAGTYRYIGYVNDCSCDTSNCGGTMQYANLVVTHL
jgi:hypothetical protein